MKKVLLITEYLNPPYDEGIKKTVYNLFLDLDKKYVLQVICRYGFKKDNIHIIDTNPLFFSKDVKWLIRDFNPDSLVYFPFQSSTFASYLRLKVLSIFAKKTKIIFIALQPKPLKKWQQFMVRYIKPKLALTPSPSLQNFWKKLNINSQLVPLLTDLAVFMPIGNLDAKRHLRKKYNLPLDAFIVSHMGHLNEGRNLKTLIPLQKEGMQVVIVGSSSTPKDAKGELSLKEELLNSGIIVIDRFIENIEEIYQLSDIYIFPVKGENSSIGMPLSILEARACGIPVITTNYGSVEYFLKDDFKGIVYTSSEMFSSKVKEIKNQTNLDVKKTNVNKLNVKFNEVLQNFIELRIT